MDKNHFLIAGLILLLGVSLSLSISLKFHSIETETINARFKKAIDEDAFLIEQQVKLNFEAVYVLKTLFDNSQEVTRAEFREAARSILTRHDKILAMAWTEKVTAQQRASYESKWQREFPNFRITQFSSENTLQPAANRAVYFPNSYLEPFAGNEAALGFDVASEPARLEALTSAIDSGEMRVTRSITLARKPFVSHGFLAVLPVYHGNPQSVEERREAVEGVVIGAFLYATMLDNFISKIAASDIEIKLLSHGAVLYASNEARTDYPHQKVLTDIGGKTWNLLASPTDSYFSRRRTSAPYIIFALGSLFVLTVAAYTLLVLRHTGIVEHIVQEKTNELTTAKHELELLTKIDSLTGLYNRRYFEEYLQQEWKRAMRERTALSIMMLDIDYFKYFNDHYGHLIGDDSLKTIAAALLKSAQRSTDIVARYGGEEFIMILPNTGEPLPIAEKCRLAVESLAIPHRHSPPPQIVTISIGVSCIVPQPGMDPTELIHKADIALYKAKQLGRNRVEFQA
jgi:diguanylate cyclase (GGDEF)-like protein